MKYHACWGAAYKWFIKKQNKGIRESQLNISYNTDSKRKVMHEGFKQLPKINEASCVSLDELKQLHDE